MQPVTGIQAEEIWLFRALCGRIDARVMVDVGAHHGTTLEPFLRAGFEVHAFEPVEANRSILESRFAQSDGLTIHPEAVSRASGTASLNLAAHPDGSTHDHYHSLERLQASEHHRAGGTVEVPTVSIDDLIGGGELPAAIGMLKVDTEGHDLAVLEGASRARCEVVCVEFWGPGHPLGPSPSPPERMAELMRGCGYGCCVVIEHAEGSTALRIDPNPAFNPGGWGNILFFHESAERPLAAARAWCDRGGARALSPVQRVLLRSFPGRTGLRVYDVGAFRGDFTSEVLEVFPESGGILFEPAPKTAADLVGRFGSRPGISVREVALSDRPGRAPFHFIKDAPATSGLLAPLHRGASSADSVELTTLDQVAEADEGGAPDVLKVDTQGHDLRVLEGGRETLAAHHPVVVAEAIFAPLYEGQAEPYEMIAFLGGLGYRLGRILNVHHTTGDELAFADLVFVPYPADPYESSGPFPAWEADGVERLRDELRAVKLDRRDKLTRLRSALERARRG